MKRITIRNVTELVSIWAISSLILGCIIVNLYLGQFGFWDYNFLRFQYIASGTIFLLLTLVTCVISVVFFLVYTSVKDHFQLSKNSKSFQFYFLKIITFGAIVCINAVVFMIVLQGKQTFSYICVTILLSIIWVLPICIMLQLILRIYLPIKPENTLHGTKYLINEYLALLKHFCIPIGTIFILAIFSSFIYPHINRVFGGGHSETVIIYFKDSNEQIPAIMLYQSSDSVLINYNNGTFLIPQDQIRLLQYTGRNTNMIKSQNEIESLLN